MILLDHKNRLQVGESFRRRSWQSIGIVGVCLAVVSLSIGCVARTHAVRAGVKTYYYGNVTSGGAFGIHIGEYGSDVTNVLKTRMIAYIGETECDRELLGASGCKTLDADRISLYSIKQVYRHGNLYIAYKRGRAISVSWQCYFLPYIDF